MATEFGRGKFENSFVTLVDEGTYEGVIVNANINKGKNGDGKPRIEITIKFRDDVEQSVKGDLITYRIFKNDDDEFFNSSKLNNIIITQDRFPTYKNHFDVVDEVVQYLNGLCLTFQIENQFNDYFGEERSSVKDWGFDITKHPGYKGEIKKVVPTEDAKPSESPKAETPLTADDLPF